MRRKLLKLSAGWVLCAAAWAACGGETTVTRKELGYQITFPDGYAVGNDIKGTASRTCTISRAIAAKKGSWVGVDVHVDDVKEGDSLRSLFTIPMYREWLKNFALIAVDIVKVDGRNILKIIVSDGQRRYLIYYTVANAHGYSIWCQVPEGDFNKHVSEMEAIVSSFKIIEAK